MPLIKSCADLRNNYNEISRICHETKEPIYITGNGTNDLVILSGEAYENLTKSFEEAEEERIDRIVSKHFDEHYSTFKEFQASIFQKINEAIREIDEGKGIPMKNIVAEL